MYVQGVQTLSGQSNFDGILGKSGQKSKLNTFSWSQIMHNLF